MELLAKTLPVWPFFAGVRGASAKTLAIIVAEAGDLSKYPKKGHLWTRLGLGVRDGKRQGSIPPGLSGDARRETWKDRKYSPHRRAETFALIDDVLLRAQWQHATALGPYGAHYARKKAEYIARDKSYADRSARRYTTKRFIRDLWKAWRAASGQLPNPAVREVAPVTLAKAAD